MTDAQISKDREALLGQVVEDFFECVDQGKWPEMSDYLRRYPEIADQLKVVIPAMLATERAAHRSERLSIRDTVSTERRLGDFQILRQIGRGGNGDCLRGRADLHEAASCLEGVAARGARR